MPIVKPAPPTTVLVVKAREVAVVVPVTQPSDVKPVHIPESICITGVAALRLVPRALIVIMGYLDVATNLYHTSADDALPHVPGTPAVAFALFSVCNVRFVQVAFSVNNVAPVQLSLTGCAKDARDIKKKTRKVNNPLLLKIEGNLVFMDWIFSLVQG